MAEDVFVISDLHAGGKPGFQMLTPTGLHAGLGERVRISSEDLA